jgi:(1->4)-alpha-D-glucan 1-alpha-D-glucosylmutase
MYNSLGQTLLKLAVPGVADCYQGTELWDLSFVDPDNRRPVDFAGRQRMLRELKISESKDRGAPLRDLLAEWPDGRIKLYLLHKLLSFRRDHRDLFDAGEYLPLQATGDMADRVCAFARRKDPSWALAIVPCLIGREIYRGDTPLGEEFWRGTVLNLAEPAPDRWIDVISGGVVETALTASTKTLELGSIFQSFPVAFLCNEEAAAKLPKVVENSNARSIQQLA